MTTTHTPLPMPGDRRQFFREISSDALPVGAVRRITRTFYAAGYATIADERTHGWDAVADDWSEETR